MVKKVKYSGKKNLRHQGIEFKAGEVKEVPDSFSTNAKEFKVEKDNSSKEEQSESKE